MAGRTIPSSRHFRLHEIADGVYASVATEEGWAVANTGIVDLGDHTLVFDTSANHLAAEDLKKAAESATDKSVDYVLISHGHRDHIKGNQVFRNATIAATHKTREAMAQNWKKRSERVAREGIEPIMRGVEEEFGAWKSNPATTETDRVLWESYEQAILQGIDAYNLKLPNVSFETVMRFHGSKRTAEAISFGGGHSESDVILYLPEERVAYLGDLLFIGFQPYIAEGNPDELLRILDKVEALDLKVLVPGHGPVGTSKDIQVMRDYVIALQRITNEVRASGGNTKEAAEGPIPPPFDSLKWRAFWKENLEFLLQRKADSIGK
jgi:cyclase